MKGAADKNSATYASFISAFEKPTSKASSPAAAASGVAGRRLAGADESAAGGASEARAVGRREFMDLQPEEYDDQYYSDWMDDLLGNLGTDLGAG